MLYFRMILYEDKYIYLKWYGGDLYLYSVLDKTYEQVHDVIHHGYKIKRGEYLLIFFLGNNDIYYFSVYTNHYLVGLEKSEEISVSIGTRYLLEPTAVAVADLSMYENEDVYLVSDSLLARIISCEKSLDIESIVQNGESGINDLYSHIAKLTELNTCNPPYYNIRLCTTRFELVTQVYDVNTSQNFTFKQKDTVAFTVRGNGYNLVLSNQENLKWLDKMEAEFVNVILSNEQIQFKLKPDSYKETNLRIKIFENKNNKIIYNLTNDEISERVKYDDNKAEIKYYLNLAKTKYIIHHFDYIGKLEFYISKEDINENIIENILNTDEINLDLFHKVLENNTFELGMNKTLAIKKVNKIHAELLMTPSIHDFIIENVNSKYLISKKRYLIRSYMIILLEENSEAVITINYLNGTQIYSLDKNNNKFENKNFNQLVFITSDKDALIYVYYNIKNNSKNFVENKNDLNSELILFSSDCENNKLKYISDFGFEKYVPLKLSLMELSDSYLVIPQLQNATKIQKGANYITYMECEYNLINNYSGIFEKSTMNEGSNIIEKNQDLHMHINLDENKKNIFYQIIQCEQKSNEYEFITIIDGNEIEELDKDKSFVYGENEISLFIKSKEKMLFNYYKTKSNEDDYNRIVKNENPYFNISFLSKQQIKIDIIPIYKDLDFEFYFFMKLDNKTNSSDNPFEDKCYLKEIINSEKNTLNAENIKVKKIEFKNSKITNNIIDSLDLEEGDIIHYNILGLCNIFEDAQEYIFYNGQSHKIQNSDFPSEPISPPSDPSNAGENDKQEDHSLSVGAIVGIVFGCIALVAIGVFVFLKCRRKDSIDLESGNKEYPLTMENKN